MKKKINDSITKTPLRNNNYNDETGSASPGLFKYLQWHKVKDGKRSHATSTSIVWEGNKNIVLPNMYDTLSDDEWIDNDSYCDTLETRDTRKKEVSQEETKHDRINQGRPNIVLNHYPENDSIRYRNPKFIPGNSTYAQMTRQGEKVLILSDSITTRIKIRDINRHIKNGFVFRKSFAGATPTELAHYCTPTLSDETPDSVIIHVGTNRVNKDEPNVIANDILNIVDVCKHYGVNNVFISAITYRQQFMDEIDEINNIIRDNQECKGFNFIGNNNITGTDLWKDSLHLNDYGLNKLANNFINAINCEHLS